MNAQELKTYNLLSAPIRRYIKERGWNSFRPIQLAAINHIMATTDKNYILASKTASGKTEAAFFPILSKVNFNENGVHVLYISPLISLINDQVGRIEDICKYLDIPVTKWHGEADVTKKKRLEKDPQGIVLTTPESLEAMFARHPERVYNMFSNLKYIIIDEVHYFIGSDRGIQLQSLIGRLQDKCPKKIVQIGLSATIGNFTLAKMFTGDEPNTVVLLDRTQKNIDFRFDYFRTNTPALPLDLIKKVFQCTFQQKALIFPNTRGRVEEIAVNLKRLSTKVNGSSEYYAHHASIDKEEREEIEHFAKNSKNKPFCICCTSTLELGIDIGNVDRIVQIDSTHSVSSMIQRAGRSGRSGNAHAIMDIISTNPLSLVQSLSCWSLYQKGIIESPLTIEKPYDVLLHQAMSIVTEHSEISVMDLIDILSSIPVFSKISRKECAEIIRHLVDTEILEIIQGKLIIGFEGEKIVNSIDFYSQFITGKMYCVYHNNTKIGELQPNPMLRDDLNIFLAARVWTIQEIDSKRMKIFVTPANDGRPPIFLSDSALVAYPIEREMFDILYSSTTFPNMESDAADALDNIRKDYSRYSRYNMPVWDERDSVCLHPLMGTLANNAIKLLLETACKVENEGKGTLKLDIQFKDLKPTLLNIINSVNPGMVDTIVTNTIAKDPLIISRHSKFGHLLPTKYQVELLKQKAYDFDNALVELQTLHALLP